MASQVTSDLIITAADLTHNSSTQMHNLGERAVTTDGRSFRYAKAGGTALVQGKLYQAPAEVTNHQNLTPTATAVGSTSLTVTLGATAATANQYAGGWVVVAVTPGEGYQYKIKSHPAASSAASLTLTLEDPILVALTTSSRVDLVTNPFNGVIINPASASSCAVGVAVYPVTAGQYGWIQVGGPAVLLANGAIAVSNSVVSSNGVDGAVEPLDSTSTTTVKQTIVGVAMTGIANAEYGAVMLFLK